ncbi:TRAP transporter substrate-binding protein DctP [Leadbettera azotonutricia]|uniref:Putative trap dicarboxylate transporter-dctp subunit n=1 Tax=Leadbettera azotonutricia (strain ATCC BAA-888 / DSM 13862 / ZAS-9) TaxID=545695 RepID=F5YC35_LEAAZ|nr:TRAP transporter substrate-binding protein DctP [Leadbettera azotonutricia]AEF82977.1 putative trap dicarboxylate transporter- dctp subunit [Leadbettera azotonutricia ZAS-9]
MKKFWYAVFFCLVCFCVVSPESAFAQRRKITIKLASLVPENTPWGSALNRMARDWAAATNGEVSLQIYHNGSAGSEADVLRKLKGNQIQAAILSSFGLNTITPEIMTLSCPFLIRDNTELDLVLNELKPELERLINEKGFYTLAWSKAGWVKFFSKQPVYTPADMKRQKLGTNENEPALMDAFKAMGYQMVPVAMNQVLVYLNGGMIDAVYQSPVNVGGLQIFGVAKNMSSINIAPFMGGIVLNQAAWRSIPDQYKPELIRIAKNLEKTLDTSIQELEASAIETMRNYGLIVNQATPAQQQLWYDDVNRIVPTLLGKTFDRAMYTRIEGILKTRRGQ